MVVAVALYGGRRIRPSWTRFRGCEGEQRDAFGCHRRGARRRGRGGQGPVVQHDERVGQRLGVGNPGVCGQLQEELPHPVPVLLNCQLLDAPAGDSAAALTKGRPRNSGSDTSSAIAFKTARNFSSGLSMPACAV
ncbi:MAG: hypothetical protein QOD02_769 [Mycobacterium sp.]|nr:hypothetical protein [Mycobacterium sp.]